MKIKTKSCLPKFIISFWATLGILCLLNGLVCSQEAGDRWQYVSETTDDTICYQDRTYKVLSNGNKVIWEKYLNKDGSKTLLLVEYNCKQTKMRNLEQIDYDTQGNVANSQTFRYPGWVTPIPDSMSEASYENVCSSKSSAPTAPPAKHRTERQVTPPPAKGDIGVDYGIVTSVRANLREGPGTDTAAILSIPKGEMVVLLDGGDDSGWYNVVHVKSNSEGFIHESTISIYLTQNRKPTLTIQGSYSGSNANLSIEVNNDSTKTMTLKMDQIRYVFSPQETKTIILAPGKYNFHASAPNVIPDFGEQDFQAGYRYTWRFYIVTRRR